MTGRGFLRRLAVGAAAFVLLGLLVRHAPEVEFDEHVADATPCGVDSLTARPDPQGIIDLMLGGRPVGQLSLLGTSVSVGETAETLTTPHHASAGATAVTYRVRAPRTAARYAARVLPVRRTVHVSLAGRVHGTRFDSGVISAVTNGFALVAAHGRRFTGGHVELVTLHPWVRLRSGRCSLLVWGRGLRGVKAAWRPGFPTWADLSFLTSSVDGGRLALNFTFVYGDDRRSLAFIRRSLSAATR